MNEKKPLNGTVWRENLKDALDIINTSQNFLFSGDIDPDSVGSMLSLSLYLHQLDKKVFLILPENLGKNLDFFEKIIDLAKEHKIWVIQDLAYADICFDGYQAPSILQVKVAKEVAVEFFTLSKSYNMPGWRVGFCCGNKELLAALSRIKSYFDYGLFTPIQVAAIKALDHGDEYVESIRAMYQSRRDVLIKGLNNAGWRVESPKATMFIWAKIPTSHSHLGSLEFSKQLLADAKVAVSPGIGFGSYGEGYVRFSLIENEHRSRQAIRNIKKFLSNSTNVQAIK